MKKYLTPTIVIILAIVIVFCVFYLIQLKNKYDYGSTLLRESESRLLNANEQIQVLRMSRDELEQSYNLILSNNKDLEQEIAKVKNLLKKSKVSRVMKASTGPIVCDTKQTLNSIDKNVSHETECLLRSGDTAEIRVIELELTSALGNKIAKGKAQTLRLLPKPQMVIVEGNFDRKLTHIAELSHKPVEKKMPWWQHELIGFGVGITISSLILLAK